MFARRLGGAQVAVGRSQHDLAELANRFGELFGRGLQRLGKAFDRAERERLERGLGAASRKARQYDHRQRLGAS